MLQERIHKASDTLTYDSVFEAIFQLLNYTFRSDVYVHHNAFYRDELIGDEREKSPTVHAGFLLFVANLQ